MTYQKVMNYTVFSKDGCPYCEKIKQVLELTGSNFVVYTLGEQFDRDAFYGEFGEGSTFPQVVVDGKKLGGCTDTIQYLKEHQVIKT
jgi:glutaredoxin|tara:strand:+ start:1085 stop:1345 length:261 start_codon:yes stop_codon:yes gene_type:complete